MAIQLGGLSGFDTNAIVEQLMQIERRPLYQLENEKKMVELKKELFSEINSNLVSLQSKTENLFKFTTFNQYFASSSNEDVAEVTLNEDAILGNYNLVVNNLATATSVTSSTSLESGSSASPAQITSDSEVVTGTGYLDTSKTFLDAFNEAGLDTTNLQDGTITINGVSFEIDIDSTTIDGFTNMVNGDPEVGVTLSYNIADPNNDIFIITTEDDGSDASIELADDTGFFAMANITTMEAQGSGTADPTATLAEANITDLSATGTIYFRINGYSFSYDTAVTSLDDVINEINSSNAGVTMFYDSETDKVTVTQRETGAGLINFEDVDGNFLEALHLTTATQQEGQEASFTLNGHAMTRSSNEFELNGVNFTLEGQGTTTINVEKDIDAVYESIQEFVAQYNSAVELLNTRLSEKPVEDASTEAALRKGLLRGDSTLAGLRSSMRQLMTEEVSGLNNKYTTLMEIGITTTSADHGKSGKLEIDEERLKEVLAQNPESLRKLFFNDNDEDEKVDDGELGVAAKLYNKLEQYINDSTTSYNGRTYKVGIIPMRLDSMDNLLDDYDDQIYDFERRLEKIEERYWRQFTAMEQALVELQNQQSWLSSQLSNLMY
ncbi:MAG: flagellar filament capping protein FliD [Halanaerobium sp.]|nr:flagellar filament capping protein FliD [Halanaerobium sp.]